MAVAAPVQDPNYGGPKAGIAGAVRSDFALKARLPGTEFLDAETGHQKSSRKSVNACRDQSPGSKWPEIPAESPYLASTREMVVCEDWMVVEAVLCEPVSIKFPAKQGKNREIPSFLAALSVFGDNCDLNSSTCCRFP